MKPIHVFILAVVVLGMAAALPRAEAASPVLQPVSKLSPTALCDVCEGMLKVVEWGLQTNASAQFVASKATNLCIGLHIEDKRVCHGIVETYADEFMYILTHLTTTEGLCERFRLCPGLMPPVPTPLPTYRVPHTPAAEALSERAAAAAAAASDTRDVGYFLHLADLHVDEWYTVGAEGDCGEPICCRADDGPGKTPETTAGKWGSYICDIPVRTYESGLAYIRDHFDLDFALYTGDEPPHDVWKQSREHNLFASRTVVNLTKTYLPDVAFFPVLGNHESYPCDQFSETEGSMEWLYAAHAKMWGSWLGAAEVEEFMQAGYYSAHVRPGLRLLALNTQHCDTINFWLLLNDTDPSGQLAWMRGELAAARAAGEMVYIAGHIPIGMVDCLADYEVRFRDVLAEYADVIVGSFYGHTHNDEVRVMTPPQDPHKPLHVQYIAPSMTTFTNLNPSFRVFAYDRATFEIIDYDQYHMNVTKSNAEDKPAWAKYYGARDNYGLASLSPVQWYKRMRSMEDDDAMMERYFQHFYTGQRTGFAKDDRVHLLCRGLTSTAYDYYTCVGAHSKEAIYAENVRFWKEKKC